MLLAILYIASIVVSLISPVLLGIYIDALNKQSSFWNIILYCCVVLFLLQILSGSVNYFMKKIAFKIRMNSSKVLYVYIYNNVLNMPLKDYQVYNPSYLNERVTTDSNNLVNFIMYTTITVIINIIKVFVCVLLTFKINIIIGLAIIIYYPIYWIIYKKSKNNLKSKSLLFQEEQNKYFSTTNNEFLNFFSIKLKSFNEESIKNIENSYTMMFNSGVSYSKISYLYDLLINSLTVLHNFIFLILFAIMFYKRSITIGQFTILTSYFSITINGLTNIMEFGKSYQDAQVALKRLNNILCKCVSLDGKIKFDKIESIILSNISYMLNIKEQNFSYEFYRGKVYLIRGKNGIGKTTLLNAMAGVNELNSGKIYYNDIDMENINKFELRKNNIFYLQQEPSCYFCIMEYLSIRNNNINKIEKLSEILNIKSLIKRIESLIERNEFYELYNLEKKISGGEKQKLCILSAILSNSDVFLMDEPSSALDSASILLLNDYILKYKNKIIIIVSHDDQFTNIADEVINL